MEDEEGRGGQLVEKLKRRGRCEVEEKGGEMEGAEIRSEKIKQFRETGHED